jgi:citryl-CoA lyase
MKFETKISKTENGEHAIYGMKMTELMKTHTFTEVIFLLYAGKLPTDGERALLDTLLVAASEHGIETPSAYVPRVSAASGNSVHTAMAAGMLAMGEAHGGAGEAAARMLARDDGPEEIVAEYTKAKKNIPGFGHRIYKDEDPRAAIIYAKAKEAGKDLQTLAPFEKAYAVEAALRESKGKKLPLNIDGAFAAATLAFGMRPDAAKALFVLARTAGMGAHALEELSQNNGYQRLDPSSVS